MQIRCAAKVLKNWYACTVPEKATLSDVYNEYIAGILEQDAPLPERYNTAFVVASTIDNIHCVYYLYQYSHHIAQSPMRTGSYVN